MKIGLVSDTHNEIKNLEKAVGILFNEYSVDMLVHLGDDYDDTLVLDIDKNKLLSVPGVFSSYYYDPDIEKRIIKKIKNKRFLITHTPDSHQNDPPGLLRPEDLTRAGEIDVVLHGHTHIPRVEKDVNGIIWINPGHLRNNDRKAFPPTFAVVDIDDAYLDASIIELNTGRVRLKERYEDT